LREVADAAWTQVGYNISAYADNRATVYVRWGHRVGSADAYAYSGWNLDDIQLLGLSSSPLNLLLPATASEAAGVLTNGGMLRLTAALPTNLVVALGSGLPSRLTVAPATTIPAGQLAGSFDLTLVDNLIQDGHQTVLITASADGFTNVSSSVLVIDDDTPPQVTVQPASQSVVAGNAVTFSATASGKAPLSYAWNRNGIPIDGATASSYTTNNVQVADSGSQFSCLVSNVFGTARSSNALLTVLAGPMDYFTEWFDHGARTNELAYRSFTFTPDGSANYYAVCQEAASAFPTDPTGSTTVSLGDNAYYQVTLSGTNTVAIYNRRAKVFFIGSNGYVTMGSGDTTSIPSYTNHFNRPRVSAFFCDLKPAAGGTVLRKQLSDHVAVTYQNVPQAVIGGSNSFQIELFYDGHIRVTYLRMDALLGVAGLSAGQGVPTVLFAPSDFPGYNTCATLSPSIVTQPTNVAVLSGASATFSVVATGTLPVSYQWRFNGGNISGATVNSYAVASVQPANAGSYSVLITNAYGSILSGDAVLTVLGPPSILAGPTNLVVAPGMDATFAVTASGTPPLAYQWRCNGTDLAGAVNSALTLTHVTTAQAGSYAVLVTNGLGSALSSNAVLTITGPCLTVCPGEPSQAGDGRTNFVFVFPSVGGVTYVVQCKDVLADTNEWLPLITNSGTGGLITNNFPVMTDPPCRFYRLLIP